MKSMLDRPPLRLQPPEMVRERAERVMLALLPAAIMGIYHFGFRSLYVMIVSVFTCVFSEYAWQRLRGIPIRIGDMSAALTGLLLAMCLSPGVPLWLPIVGGAFAIIIAKQMFGGLGQNFVNPPLAAYAFLQASWPVYMAPWIPEGVTGPTALAMVRMGGGYGVSIADALIGHGELGSVGETSVVALLAGAAFLIWKREIDWRQPIIFIGTVFAMTTIFGRAGVPVNPFHELLLGGLFLGAFFMATDPGTIPSTGAGRCIFALGCGLLTSMIRLWGTYAEGIAYSILLMNLTVPIIEDITQPRTPKEAEEA